MTTRSWGFSKTHATGYSTVEITIELRDDDDHLHAIADDDDYYYGDLTKEESLDLARTVLTKLDPPPFAVGTHVHVVDGAMCGCYGVVIGTVREDGYVILRCRDGILLAPPRFVREGP